jgi:hypothetical protein
MMRGWPVGQRVKAYIVVCEVFDKRIDVALEVHGAFATHEEARKHAEHVEKHYEEEWGDPIYGCTVHEEELSPCVFEAMSHGMG